tara:strand:+ start:3504 stop:5498 length:1995 start_codon:yes stop_codon:yes gene_type:complete
MTESKIEIDHESVELWLQKIDSSEQVLEENHLPYWRAVQKDYSATPSQSGGLDFYGDSEGEVKFNFLLSNANTILPGVISANPYIYVKPRRPGDKESAKIAQGALNYIWNEIGANQTTRKIVLDALLFGLGFGKVGYDPSDAFFPQEDYDTGPEQEMPGEGKDPISRAQQRRLRDFLGNEQLSFDEGPNDNPMLTRVAPWNLIVPPGYTDLNQCPWVAERLVVRLDDLRADDRFDVPEDLKPDSWLSDAVPESLGSTEDNITGEPEISPDYVVIYELRYWANSENGMRRRIMWLVKNPGSGDSMDSVLRHVDDPLEMKGYPYEGLRFIDVPDSFYSTHVSDLSSIRGISDRLNDEWAYVLRHHRLSSRRKFVAMPGVLEGGQLTALLESEEDMEVAEIPAGVARIQDALMILPEAPPPSTTSMVISGLQKMMYEISGVDSFQRGGASRKGTTATEVAIASAATQGRVGVRLEATERFVSHVSRKILSIIRQYWDETRYLRINGSDGEDEFIAFTSSDIQGYYDVNVQAGSTLPTNPAEEQQAFLGLLQTMQQVMGTMMPLVQGGILPPDSIQNFMDQAFSVWRQDRQALVGPLSQLQGAAMGGAGLQTQPTAEGQVGPEGVESMGLNPQNGESLAGTGPRGEQSGNAQAGTAGLVEQLRTTGGF